jgi:hypothetical protein
MTYFTKGARARGKKRCSWRIAAFTAGEIRRGGRKRNYCLSGIQMRWVA